MQEYHENQQILLHLHVIFSTCFLHHKLTGSTAKKPTLKLGSYTPISCVCISLHITPNIKCKLMDRIFIFAKRIYNELDNNRTRLSIIFIFSTVSLQVVKALTCIFEGSKMECISPTDAELMEHMCR